MALSPLSQLGPDGARVLGAHVARIAPSATTVGLVLGSGGSWVGAEEVGDELITIVVEQRGLRREEHDRRRQCLRGADVVLGADGVTHEERLVPRWHLEVVRHGWRCDFASVGGAARPRKPRREPRRTRWAGCDGWSDAMVHGSASYDLPFASCGWVVGLPFESA